MTKSEGSKLVPAGVLILLLSFLARPTHRLAESLGDSPLAPILMIGTDLFRLCFFIGITCLIIGVLRNRKPKSQSAEPNTPPSPE